MALSRRILIIEVPILLIFFCFMLSDYVTTNFVIYRSCYITLGYNKSDCALLGTDSNNSRIKELEKNVQPTASLIMMCKTIIDTSISVFFSLIAGPWSNKHGRKPILISSFIGYFLAYLAVITISLLEWVSPWYWLSSCVIASLGGGFCSMLTVTFCYIADTTSEENRGVRMGLLEACFSVGSLLGTLSSSFVFKAVGYTGIYCICAVISCLATIYLSFVPESVLVVEQENKLRHLMDVSSVTKSIKVCFKRRPNMDRLLLGLLMSLLIIYIFVIFSDSGIFFLYVREKFSWTLEMYTLYSATSSFIDVLVSMSMLIILHKYLKINDMTLIIIGFISLCASSVIFGIANANWFIFLGAGIKRLSGAVGPLGRSAISMLLPPDDLGHVFAFTTSLETIVQLISSPLYTLLYNATIKSAPNAFNFLSAAIYFLNVIITSAVILIRKYYPSEHLRLIDS